MSRIDVAREAVLQALFGHRVAAVFDDDGLAVKLADVGQRLGQDFGFQGRRDLRKVGELGHGGKRGEELFKHAELYRTDAAQQGVLLRRLPGRADVG